MNATEFLAEVFAAKDAHTSVRKIGPNVEFTCTFDMARLALLSTHSLLTAPGGTYMEYVTVTDEWARVMTMAWAENDDQVDIAVPLGFLFETLGTIGGSIARAVQDGYDPDPILEIAEPFHKVFVRHTGIDAKELLNALMEYVKE